MTSADKIQTGMYASQRSTTSGILILFTKTNGKIRGIHVTSAQPKINKIIAKVVVIFQSPPQSLPQRPSIEALLNAPA